MFTPANPQAARVALVGCSARKLNRGAHAREFYTSALFRAAITYAEAKCNAVRVVSALYGAVELDAWLEPYDRNLRAFGKRDREGWGVRTVAEVIGGFPVPPLFVVLAGQVYADALVFGAHWHNLPRPEEPLRGREGVRGAGGVAQGMSVAGRLSPPGFSAASIARTSGSNCQ
ncbi:DUF6884 domain-containing protein [Polyangium mundeleinium]|uniref:DUF6884 domain-containing protein n=1 Tax=Polyangium mundeleinium TaxID=2995306 RepID=A0ABT5EJP1_9BACT|nr:DUF6884 domain-containing protein [Polyangium mundeleinium]MDC0740951.1 hypothetical protein [Polyangium mundeleinium]